MGVLKGNNEPIIEQTSLWKRLYEDDAIEVERDVANDTVRTYLPKKTIAVRNNERLRLLTLRRSALNEWESDEELEAVTSFPPVAAPRGRERPKAVVVTKNAAPENLFGDPEDSADDSLEN
jgi:hypothetical protein